MRWVGEMLKIHHGFTKLVSEKMSLIVSTQDTPMMGGEDKYQTPSLLCLQVPNKTWSWSGEVLNL